MKTREEFTTEYHDRLCGFLVSAFVESEKHDAAMKGRFLTNQLNRVKPLLEQMHDFINEIVPAQGKKPIDALVDDLLLAYAKSPESVKTDILTKLRAAMKKPVDATKEVSGK